ncbi:MAG TPA: hypothetical protein VLV31_00510 [Candidatus Acidoferrales bacterium]|nr:hypothetical protein [Candidatus Acidoferrales bacterium]
MACVTLIADSCFNRTLLDCVDDAAKAILGDQGLEPLFVRLEAYQGLTKDQIPRNLDTFFAALERAYGESTGKTVGRFIIKLLYARLGLPFDGGTNRFLLDYVERARRELAGEN